MAALAALGSVGLIVAALTWGALIVPREADRPVAPPERVDQRVQREDRGGPQLADPPEAVVVPGELRDGDPWHALEVSHREYLEMVLERAEAAERVAARRLAIQFLGELQRLEMRG